MKTLRQHITEALKIGKNLSSFSTYSCQPKEKEELQEIINERMSKEGANCNLNDIDVSKIDDMSGLLFNTNSRWRARRLCRTGRKRRRWRKIDGRLGGCRECLDSIHIVGEPAIE